MSCAGQNLQTPAPLVTGVPVFGVVFRDGFPFRRERELPREGVAKFWTEIFFWRGRGDLFFGDGGGVQPIRRPSGQIPVHDRAAIS